MTEKLELARWQYWLPLATIASKRMGSARTLFNPAGSPVQRFRIIHSRALEKLQRLGIAWKYIVRYDLDDPRIGDHERDTLIRVAQEQTIKYRPRAEQAELRERRSGKGELDASRLS